VLIADTARRSSDGSQERLRAKFVGMRPVNTGDFARDRNFPLKTNVCSHTVGVMVSSPSPTSRSGRRLGIRRGGRSDVVHALARRLIARAIALGRPGLLGWTRELAQGVPPGGSSVPSKARPTLADMDLTPHLERLATPAKAVSRAALVRGLCVRLAGPSRARRTRSLSLRDGVVRRPALGSRIPSLALSSVVDMNRSRDRGPRAGSPRARLARASYGRSVDLATAAHTARLLQLPGSFTRRLSVAVNMSKEKKLLSLPKPFAFPLKTNQSKIDQPRISSLVLGLVLDPCCLLR